MFRNNPSLIIIAVIALVNALGYGIIIPVLYTYSHKFGLSDFQNGLLFSVFSIFQFLSTPLIGRLSDKYGRKPLLVASIAGTAISFFLMATAKSAWMLFFARALDGITAGNLPVASAVISDTTEPKDRARGFAIIGASFGFGFVFGPAISALTVGYGDAMPFMIAAAVSTIATIMTMFMLKETNKHMGQVSKAPLFDLHGLVHAALDKNVGKTLSISLIYFLAWGIFIYAYQPFSVKVLGLSANQIALNFTLFGLVGLVAQVVIIPRVTRMLGDANALLHALILTTITFFTLYLVTNYWVFLFLSVFHSLGNAFVNPLVQALLSKEVDARSQGSIMGINASYQSIGMIVGPIVGGLVATYSIPMPFLLGSLFVATCIPFALSIRSMHFTHKESAF